MFTYVPDGETLVEQASEQFAQLMRQAVRARRLFLVALSGGGTPRPVYERLAKAPYGDALPWPLTRIYFGDERMVPCDSEESNYRMACETLLDNIDIPPENLHRIRGEDSLTEAARLYDADLRGLALETGELVPRFDLMLLGIGPDGHTASLFPGTDVLENTRDFAAGVHLPESSQGAQHAQDRVTMTYPVLNASRHVLFLDSGSPEKAAALARVEAGDESAPAARVRPTDGTLQWLIVGEK